MFVLLFLVVFLRTVHPLRKIYSLEHTALLLTLLRPSVCYVIASLLAASLLLVLLIDHKRLVGCHKLYLRYRISVPIVVGSDTETPLKQERQFLR